MSIGLFSVSESLFCKSGLRQLVEALLPRDLKLGLLRVSTGNGRSGTRKGLDDANSAVLLQLHSMNVYFSLFSLF